MCCCPTCRLQETLHLTHDALEELAGRGAIKEVEYLTMSKSMMQINSLAGEVAAKERERARFEPLINMMIREEFQAAFTAWTACELRRTFHKTEFWKKLVHRRFAFDEKKPQKQTVGGVSRMWLHKLLAALVVISRQDRMFQIGFVLLSVVCHTSSTRETWKLIRGCLENTYGVDIERTFQPDQLATVRLLEPWTGGRLRKRPRALID
jgi:hypothetical protein